MEEDYFESGSRDGIFCGICENSRSIEDMGECERCGRLVCKDCADWLEFMGHRQIICESCMEKEMTR